MKVMCIMSDGFEELEAVGTIALLRRAGIPIDVFALDSEQACGRFDIKIFGLHQLAHCDSTMYDMLFLPGGPHYQKLEANEQVMNIIYSFAKANKWIAAICAAPTILGRAGMLKGKNYTCFTSMNDDFQGVYQDQYCVKDGHLITGRSAAAVIDFAFLIIESLLGKEEADRVKASIYYDTLA